MNEVTINIGNISKDKKSPFTECELTAMPITNSEYAGPLQAVCDNGKIVAKWVSDTMKALGMTHDEFKTTILDGIDRSRQHRAMIERSFVSPLNPTIDHIILDEIFGWMRDNFWTISGITIHRGKGHVRLYTQLEHICDDSPEGMEIVMSSSFETMTYSIYIHDDNIVLECVERPQFVTHTMFVIPIGHPNALPIIYKSILNTLVKDIPKRLGKIRKLIDSPMYFIPNEITSNATTKPDEKAVS